MSATGRASNTGYDNGSAGIDNADPAAAVVILNMHYTGLGIARSLAHCGVPIYGLSSNTDFFGNASRFCEFLQCPDTHTDAATCKDFLVAFGANLVPEPFLLPTRDFDLEFINRFRGELEQIYVTALPEPEILELILDKSRMDDFVRRSGLPCPDRVGISSMADLLAARSQLVFPCLAKPARTTDWRKPGIWERVGRRKVIRMQGFEELAKLYAQLEPVAPRLEVQEFILGPDDELLVFGAYANIAGGLIRYFTGRKLLQYPAGSGTGIVVEARPVPEIVEPSIKLLEALEYRGICEIEYKRDPRSDRIFFIELNPRHWDQHALGVSVGVNLSEIMYRDLTGGRSGPRAQCADPVKWIAEDGFAISFLANLRQRYYPLKSYRLALTGHKTWAVFDSGDLKPFFKLAAVSARNLIRKLGTGLRGLLKGRRAA